jgi:hypothetical protein
MATIKVVVRSPIMLHGQRLEAGTALALHPLDAGAAVDSRRCAYVDPEAALPVVRDAVRRAAVATIGELTPPARPIRFGTLGRVA